MGLGLSSLACCFSSAACSLCCAGCPSCRNSTASRIAYGIILIVATGLSLLSLSPFFEKQLAKIGPLCDQTLDDKCKTLVGYVAVYRVMFSLTLFFVFMAILMIGVKTSKDKRAAIQNGFWAPKILLLIGVGVGAFFIPQGHFESVWMYFGLLGGFGFILVQLVLLIDFAFNWNEKWVGRMEEDGGRKWFYLLLSVTMGIFLLCTVGIVLMYVFYGHAHCTLNKFFISFNLILCVGVSVLSVTPCVQDKNPSSGLLQSAVVSGYVMFITWSAMSTSTTHGCNPSLKDIVTGHGLDQDSAAASSSLDASSIASVVIWVLLVMYSSVSTAGRLGAANSDQDTKDGGFLRMEGAGGETDDNDGEKG